MYTTQCGIAIAAVAVALSLSVSGANAIPIQVGFNFVPTGTLTANTGDVTTATTITSGAPDVVTTILQNNIQLASGTTIAITSPTPVTLGFTFTKSFTTPLGSLLENLTVTLVTPGPSSRGITATGTISQTSGTGFDPTSVFYSAAYTQNGGPGAEINGSFNDSTTPSVPGPVVGAGLPGLVAALGGLVAMARARRRRNQLA
jgi:hypothetical protein